MLTKTRILIFFPVCSILKMIHSLLNSVMFILSVTSLCVFAQNNDVSTGSRITAEANSNPWLSPSGDFAFGFQPLQNNSDLFVLSIWFNRIPDRTIVWFERTSYPVPSGSTLQLDAVQGLVLRDSRNVVLWNANGSSEEIAHGHMNDTGNFILYGRNSSWLWQSFSNPSDTILPTQTIQIGGRLVSRRTEMNFSEGRFYAQMLESGNFVLNTRSDPWNSNVDAEYYTSQTSGTNASESGYQLLFNDRGVISVTRRNEEQTVLTVRSIPSATDNYYRATLNFDGVFTQFYHPRSFSDNPGWRTTRYWPENICYNIRGQTGSGACGYNSICTLENQRPVCECPRGFSLADPSDPHGDCLPRFTLNCFSGEDSSAFEMLRISDTDWPSDDFEVINNSSENSCRDACLNDCVCSASVYRSHTCWKKKLPLSNGQHDATLSVTAFIKIRISDVPQLTPNLPTPNQPRRDQRTLILIVSVLLGSSVIINFLLISAACLGFFLIYKKNIIPFLNPVQSNAGANLRYFTYKVLVHATDDFKEELGRGAFGIVYKGAMTDDGSRSVVAVKKLDRVSQDTEKEFRAEVNTIGQTHHKNLVRLLGFCDEGANRLLVYEYVSNGALSSFLFGTSKISWSLRCQIAQGIARGLTYLHEECITPIIHCDIKPQNILIDEYYNARISDFGLAKLLGMNQTRTLTNIRGTKGYVAPEWFRNTKVTVKVDVYSFGVLLLEIISCRRNVEKFDDEENSVLTDWAWDCFRERRLYSLVNDDEEALSDRKRLERFVMVGIWCIQEDTSLRPTMRNACQMLEGIVEIAMPPCPYLFSYAT